MLKTRKRLLALSIGAIGVVFGDIGTSPLYALQAVFGPLGLNMAPTAANVYGVISLIIWSITFVVSFKYLAFIMRADNDGEGGILALVALIKDSRLNGSSKRFFILMGLVGVSLFYGDSIITPAISVLSAIEGLKVVEPSLAPVVVPLTLVILTLLFAIQRYGTEMIGRLFGPVMLLWFAVIGAAGATQLVQHPEALQALSPILGISLFVSQPLLGLFAMGAVVLAITGAEALYADMGHFGRAPIARSWFAVVFPALALCYMGQGAVLLQGTNPASSSFFMLFPSYLVLPAVILAAAATFIASQSVISGAYSLTRQAIQLGFIPKMRVFHTSVKASGQIYLPFVNGVLFVLVSLLVIYFGSSARLASAFGVAVSGTLATDTLLFLVVSRTRWDLPRPLFLLLGLIFIPIDAVFISATLPKILTGGWVPITIAILAFTFLSTWITGQKLLSQERRQLEGPLQAFVENIHSRKPPVERSAGVAVYIAHHPDYTPLALRATVNDLHELPQKVVIVVVATTNAAHVPEDARYSFSDLNRSDGICQLKLNYGYHDPISVPQALQAVRSLSPELDFATSEAAFFVSLSKVSPTRGTKMAAWRKHLFTFMSRNELSPSDYFKLPIERTEEMTTLVRI